LTQAEADSAIAVVDAGQVPSVISERARREWRRGLLAFAITTVGFVLLVGAFAVAYDSLHAGRILPGVEVAAVPVGGLDRAQAEAHLRGALPDPSAGRLAVHFGDSVETISYAEIGRDYDMAWMLGQAFSIGRDGWVVEELRTLNHGGSVPVAITWDKDALIARMQAIANEADADPVDAGIAREGAGYVVTPALAGRNFDRGAAYLAAVGAISDPTLHTATISIDPTAVPAGIGTAAAQAVVDRIENAVGAAVVIAADGKAMSIPASVLRGWIRLTDSGGAAADRWSIVIEPAPIAQVVSEFKEEVDIAAVNASYTFQAGEAVVVPAANGQAIDAEATIAAIVGALKARAEGSSPQTINLSLATVAPEFTTTQAQGLVARIDRLGRWTTRFDPGPLNANGVNIKVPAKQINGTVVAPGEMFDFIDAAGPFTRRNGYDDGAAIRNGRTIFDGVLGGGLCSASTTLFNAAARAGFQIDRRHNHAYYIGRYPVGLDATIWEYGGTRKTMAFTNDSEYPILIRGLYAHGRVTFEIWGVPDGRTVDFSKPRIEREREATTNIRYTDELAPGEFKRVEFKVDGFDSWVTRTVRNAQGVIIHENTWFSDYRKVDGMYELGRSPGDPRAGTVIPAADFVPPEVD